MKKFMKKSLMLGLILSLLIVNTPKVDFLREIELWTDGIDKR